MAILNLQLLTHDHYLFLEAFVPKEVPNKNKGKINIFGTKYTVYCTLLQWSYNK